MARTALNVAGDCAVSVTVARSEGQLDQDVYDTAHVLRADDLSPAGVASAPETARAVS